MRLRRAALGLVMGSFLATPVAFAEERAGSLSLGGGAATSTAQGQATTPQPPAASSAPSSTQSSAPSSAGTSRATAPGATVPTATAPAGTGAATPEAVRRDPQGVRGISPFWEELKRGDNAYLARSYDVALEHYRKATMLDPQQALGHLRMAEVQLRTHALEDAEQSLIAATRFSAAAPALRAKAFFLLAMLRERQNATDEAIASWRAYERLAPEASPEGAPVGAAGVKPAAEKAPPAAEPAPKIHTATAIDRIARLEAKKQRDAEYPAVKERIQNRLEEAEQNAAKNVGK